ncbi:MAG: DUF2330 domain-containing protein [Dehalococcoidia bacterium]|nr:DUF2330 domain-containing protein [Dehalococcoidia bacterium]
MVGTGATPMRSCGLALCSALLCACLLILSLPPLVLADSGMIPVLGYISVYEPGQKAIIGWNGEYEVLILSTDVRADDDTMALQVLPLPSEPESIEQGTPDSFLRIGELIGDRYGHRSSWFDCGMAGEEGGAGVEIVFHEKIGAHDIRVVKAADAGELVEWAEDFLAQNEIEYEISSPELESVVEDYIDEGINFFVFDLIELSREEESVEPIVYQFRSDTLYYPLKISSVTSGATEITLFLVTPGRLADFSQLPKSEFEGREYGLTVARTDEKPIQFKLGKGELESIDQQLAGLLGGDAWLTAVVSSWGSTEYGLRSTGQALAFLTAYLDKDMKIGNASFVEGASESGIPTWALVVVGIGGAILAFSVGKLIYPKIGGRRKRLPAQGREVWP